MSDFKTPSTWCGGLSCCKSCGGIGALTLADLLGMQRAPRGAGAAAPAPGQASRHPRRRTLPRRAPSG